MINLLTLLNFVEIKRFYYVTKCHNYDYILTIQSMKNTQKSTCCAAAIAVLVQSAYSVELITSDGAWSTSAINASSNGGLQDNSNSGGGFVDFFAPSYTSNAPTNYVDMQATASSVQQAYTAGYTYSYQAEGISAIDNHEGTFSVQLLGNGSAVSGTKATGNNYTTAGGPGVDSNVINGSHAVSAGDAIIGQTVGMRIHSEVAVQTRFRANGNSNLIATLTDHADFSGNGILYSNDYDGSEADFVLDMVAGGTGSLQGDGYYRMNNNTTLQQELTLISATDTIRAGTLYTLTFDARRQITGVDDPTQDGLNITLGGASVNIDNIASSYTEYSAVFNADDLGIVGQALDLSIMADDVTTSGVNQHWINGVTLTATLPDSDGDGLPDSVETGTGIYVDSTNTGTDPNLADTDGDGLSDSVDLFPNDGTETVDTDGDGVGDNGDVHPGYNDAELSTYLSNNSYILDDGTGGGYTEQQLIDLRVGSQLASIANDQATLQVVIEQSDDLGAWSTLQTESVTVDAPAGTAKQFFRYRMQD